MGEVTRRNGGQVLVDALRIHGTDTVFCVPGESFLPVLDALHGVRDEVRLVVCRQEGGAAHMAEAYGKLTGRPGICFATRGPGASNASIGVHTAAQDSTPMVLFIGQVGTEALEREAWQEVDFRRMFGGMAKWATQIERADRVPEVVARAFQTAVSGRPGPVVVALPEDVLFDEVEVADTRRYSPVQAHPGTADLDRLRALLADAERPFVLLGGGGWDAGACERIRAFIEAADLPVGCTFRRQDLLDNHHPNYVGDIGLGINPDLAHRIREADLVLAIGPRLGETTTSGYTLIESPTPRQTLVHVHADPEELGRVYQAELMINAGMREFAEVAERAVPPGAGGRWAAWTEAAREDYRREIRHAAMPGPLDLGEVMAHLRETLPRDTIVTNGAGNYTLWVHRFYRYGGFRTQLAPTSGAMGYGVPAALAAKLVHPEREAVCFAGDGCFLMNGQELATAVQYGLDVLFIVINNGMYGSIRMHQEKRYPGHVHGTALANPDFVALANAYGVHAEAVAQTDAFAAALERARAVEGPALLELRIDAEAITPRTTLSALRDRAMASRSGGA
ncbi:Acetolactate synthase isozyme 2 large subunit [wastewater metagenome]|uniref:Acetolactate synthase isozyme 2 large subunit n=2 Tax=unclassified sequences TaxID=12908 RepID=A0A5B8RCU6_9ZZZZ|nr:thiamine pyrophosphate-binding protein [Arhodomonas sp. KWT]QEA05314.1 acetolactate synthase isozyme 2 large subunit [uncultured organism]